MRRILLAVGGGLFLFAGPEARVAYVTFNGLSATVSADGVENGESKARCKGVNSGAMTTSSTQVPAASSKRLPPPRGSATQSSVVTNCFTQIAICASSSPPSWMSM